MIVQQREDDYILIKQYDHSLIAGKLAANMKHEIDTSSAIWYTITHHDIGWKRLDENIKWNKSKNQPYTFVDYPLRAKLEAYREGISQLESYSAYAGYLTSQHFASFFEQATDLLGIAFYKQELERQNKLRKYLTRIEKENLYDHFCLLQFCDDLSLSLCLNEPMKNTHPWYKNGICYHNTLYRWKWFNPNQLQLIPNLFLTPFTIVIPYQIVNLNGVFVGTEEWSWQILIE